MTASLTTASDADLRGAVVHTPRPQLTVVSDVAIAGSAIAVTQASPLDMREHMIHAHHRTLVELMGEPWLITAVHRFEHVEADLDLVHVDHHH